MHPAPDNSSSISPAPTATSVPSASAGASKTQASKLFRFGRVFLWAHPAGAPRALTSTPSRARQSSAARRPRPFSAGGQRQSNGDRGAAPRRLSPKIGYSISKRRCGAKGTRGMSTLHLRRAFSLQEDGYAADSFCLWSSCFRPDFGTNFLRPTVTLGISPEFTALYARYRDTPSSSAASSTVKVKHSRLDITAPSWRLMSTIKRHQPIQLNTRRLAFVTFLRNMSVGRPGTEPTLVRRGR
jgi:hypothetical protein